MKFDIQQIKDFIIKHHILLVVTIVPVGAIIFFLALVTYNESAHFCFSCHENQGPYIYFDAERPVHKNYDDSQFSCSKCHIDKTVQTTYFRNFKKVHKNAQLVGNLQAEPLVNPKDVYQTDQCLNCHPDRLNVVERDPYLLQNEKLQRIGLRFDKRLHSRFETFRPEDQQLYQELKDTQTLTPEEQDELELLDKIRVGNCGQCHLRAKQSNGEKIVDKQVNFIARNPINCAGCHENTSSLNHPGKPLSPPTKEVCQKCHHGNIHGKFVIFKADCDENQHSENCIKCHPYYRQDVNVTSNY